MPQTKSCRSRDKPAWICSLALAALLFAACNDSGKLGAGNNTDAHLEAAAQQDEFLQIAEQLEQSQNPFLGREQIAVLERKLGNPRLPMAAVAQLQNQLWQHYLRVGDLDNARQSIERLATMASMHPNLPTEVQARIHQKRALTFIRQAEVYNCINKHNRDCCIFPLQAGGVHSEKAPAREARRSLLDKLKLQPDDLEAAWLLNLVSMAIGDYPQAVPEAYRILPNAFRSEFDIERFEDVAPQLGVDTMNLCGGAIVDDFDGDGKLDIVTSTYDPRGPLRYFRRQASGQFRDDSAVSGLEMQLGGLNCIAADYDNDGDNDILVLRGAWLLDDGQIRNSLLRNNGDRTFTDVTGQAGLAEPARPTQAAVWGDFDNDGDLDLYIGNESRLRENSRAGDYPSQLFQNNGDGTFTDIARRAGVTNDRYAKGVTAGDYDNDGDLDLYVSNAGKNRLYRNNADGTFTDVADQLGVAEPVGASFASWFFDYDNDGDLDLFVAAYDCTLADIVADYRGQQQTGVSPRLYRNDGQSGFTDVAAAVGLDHPYLPMGANFGDLDNDGFLDIYLATGRPNYKMLVPNVMLRNDGGKRFQNVTTSGGFGHLQKGHGVAFADIDNDGDQDIYHQLGGFYPGDQYRNVLFKNPGHGNRFLIVKLVGTQSNRNGVGARIRVTVNTPQGKQTLHRAVGSVSSFGGSPLRQEIGLGIADSIERIEIDWPGSATTQVLREVPLDGMIRVTEGREGFESIRFDALPMP